MKVFVVLFLIFIVSCVGCHLNKQTDVADHLIDFKIKEGYAPESLKKMAKQSGIQYISSADEVRLVKTNRVEGFHSTEEAFQILLAGTELEATWSSDVGVYSIRRRPRLPESQER